MDEEDFRLLVGALCMAIVTTVGVFLLIKLGSAMFDLPQSSNLNTMSIAACEKVGGTPVLESNGQAYKSCAINGKSDTRNVTK